MHQSGRKSSKVLTSDRALAYRARVFLEWLRLSGSRKTTILISCTRRKKTKATAARELYTAPQFNAAMQLCARLNLDFKILSAKHHLVNPETRLEPYDFSLKSLSSAEQIGWATRVFEQLKVSSSPNDRLAILADELYSRDLSRRLSESGKDVYEPLRGLSSNDQKSFVKTCIRVLEREAAAQSFYAFFEPLISRYGLSNLQTSLKLDLPAQGVYFFFDPNEITSLSNALPRLVRVGTHAVSQGSKATLRNRLRTHFGTIEGTGNHRGSVFRLHVGEAIINKLNLRAKFPHWGKGQTASTKIIRSERELESMVSQYISSLLLFFVEISDKSTKDSLRSIVETNSIALFTENMVTLESPSPNWLGSFSSQLAIRQSGLWNVRHVAQSVDLQVIRRLRSSFELKLI